MFHPSDPMSLVKSITLMINYYNPNEAQTKELEKMVASFLLGIEKDASKSVCKHRY